MNGRALPLALAALLLSGCRGKEEGQSGGWLPGDSLEKPRPGAPAAPIDTSAPASGKAPEREPSGAQAGAGLPGGEACPQDSKNPGRLDLTATWEGGHVRVKGVAEGGAGNALSLGLSQRGQFVYDQVFKSDLLNVITLKSDSIEVTSVEYEPSKSERAAFARTGAGPLDPSQPLCLDVSLYEKGSLDLLAARHLEVAGALGQKSGKRE